MSRAAAPRAGRSAARGKHTSALLRNLQQYFYLSELPLTSLLFLAPLIILYEIGTHYYASDYVRHTETRVLAFNLLQRFIHLFGATGQYLPGLAVAGILIAWHLARHDRWRLHAGVAGCMAGESAVLALPVLALSNLIGHYLPLAIVEGNWKGGLVLAIGAGIYEELVFRLMAFTILNILLIDLLRLGRRPAYLLIVVGTSILFSAYHYWSPLSAPFRWSDCIFRTLAGSYFGLLFIFRGFGITVGVHISYDIYYFASHAMAGG